MAANDYYRDRNDHYRDPNDYYRDPNFNSYSNSAKPLPRISQSDQYPSTSSLTPVPSYHSDNQGRPRLPEKDSGRRPPIMNHQYSDSIPLRDAPKIRTAPGSWQNQNTEYPPSPESQAAAPLVSGSSPSRKQGFFSGKIPWLVYILTLVQTTVFIVEIVKNCEWLYESVGQANSATAIITGSPIMIHPQFNPMIGPSTYVLINMGARFVPCMHSTPGVQDSAVPVNWPCPNTTTSDPTAASNHCNLSELCGFGGVDEANPNQWFRFIAPMFLHAGVVHIGFNMLLQLTLGREMELAIGTIRFGLVYFSSGIFGFVLGGNFAASAIASTGASGCLFGILALSLLDLIYHWGERRSPIKDLMWLMADILISFVLGLLPGLDNFSHIGGFLMGLAAGVCILHSPKVLRQRVGEDAPYRSVGSDANLLSTKSVNAIPVSTAAPADVGSFARQPVGFFKARKPLWWAWWLVRAGALIGVLVVFVILLNNFYKYRDTCSWCKYLSCLPINNWCSIGNLQLTNTTTSNSKRELADSGAVLVTDLWRKAKMQ